MANSADVSSGDLATAAQYNNLRADVLNTSSGHSHTGTDSKNLGTLTADLTISQSGASQIEVISTANDAYLILNSDTDEGQDSEIIFESGGTARGRIEYNHHATANSQLMSFFTADNAVETLKLAGNLATFATAVNVGTTATGFNTAYDDLIVGGGSGDTGITIYSGSSDVGAVSFHDAANTSLSGFVSYDHDINMMYFGTQGLGRFSMSGGATPIFRIGLSQEYDAMLRFDGHAVDYHIGLDDSGDCLNIGWDATLSSSTSIFQFYKTGLSTHAALFNPTFTSSGASSAASGIDIRPIVTGASGDTTYLTQVDVAYGSITTQAVSETITTVSTMKLTEPTITVGSGSSITNATTLYIADAPSEATNNFSLWVDSGATQLDGTLRVKDDITVDGNGKWVYLKGGTTSTNATGIAWTFNTADTRYSEILMDYDTRASVGLLIHSAYPITIDGTTQLNFDLAGTTYATLTSSTLTVTGDINASGNVYGTGNYFYNYVADDSYGGYVLRNDTLDATHIYWEWSKRNTNEDFWLIAYDGSGWKNVIKFDWTDASMRLPDAPLYLGEANTDDNATIIYDGHEVDFHIGLDDSANRLVIGTGTSLGSNTAMRISSTGNTTFDGNVIVESSGSSSPTFALKNFNADNTSAYFDWWKVGGSPADSDFLGIQRWIGKNTADEDIVYATMYATSIDVTDSTEDGGLYFQAYANGSNQNHIICAYGGVYLYHNGAQVAQTGSEGLWIGDGGAEDQVITFNGNAVDYAIGIDDTDDTYGIHVGSNITGSARRILVNSSTIYVGIDHSTSTTPTMEVFNKGASGTRSLIRFADSAERGKITHDGSSTTYSTTSDYRLKENEAEITDAIDRIHQMKPYKYNFKNIPDREKFGFFAHELAEVLPEAVIGIKDAVDENGDVQPQSIDYGRLTPLLTQAIKEIDERLKKLGG